MLKKKLELKIEEYLHDSYVDIQDEEGEDGEGGQSGEDEQDLEIQNVDEGFVPNGIIQLDPQLKNLSKGKKEQDDDSMNSEDHFIAKALMEFQDEK